MEYNDTSAAEIAEKYGISEVTLRVWKTRGKIPDKYFQEGFSPRKVAETKAEIADYNRGIEILRSTKLCAAEVASRIGIQKNYVMDAIRDDGRAVALDYATYIRLKKEIQRWRVKAKKLVEQLSDLTRFTDMQKQEVDRLISDELISLATVLGHHPTDIEKDEKARKVYERYHMRKAKRGQIFEDWEVRFILDKLSILLLETGF